MLGISKSVSSWAGVGIVLIVSIFFFFTYERKAPPVSTATAETDMRSVTIAGHEIYVMIADTESARAKGLGGRASLALDEGMLFIFDSDSRPGFWMKDMHFSIDILWLDNTGKIVYIEPDLAPEAYPKTYAPPTPSRYVLELPAGSVRRYNVHVGDIVQL